MSDAAAVQQGINAAGPAVGDSDDEWEDLEDIGIPRKGMYFIANKPITSAF